MIHDFYNKINKIFYNKILNKIINNNFIITNYGYNNKIINNYNNKQMKKTKNNYNFKI